MVIRLSYLLIFALLEIPECRSEIFPWHLRFKFGKTSESFNGSLLLRFDAEPSKTSKTAFKAEQQIFDVFASPGDVLSRDLQVSFPDLDSIRVELLFVSFSTCQEEISSVNLAFLELTSARERQTYLAENVSSRKIEVFEQCGRQPNVWHEMTLVITWHAFPC